MYSRKSWGGSVDPYILVKFMKPAEPTEATVSLVIFEWKDEELVGVYPEPGAATVCILLLRYPWPIANLSPRKNIFAALKISRISSATAQMPVNIFWHLMQLMRQHPK
jgi:hypothetical protein